MSKKLCPNCGVIMSGESSFCANCGKEIVENEVEQSRVSSTGDNFPEMIMKTGDYLFPKIVVIILATVPVLAVFSIMVVGGLSFTQSTESADTSYFIVALSFITIISSFIAYQAFKKILEYDNARLRQ